MDGHQADYIELVFDRAKGLIQTGIWDSITLSRLNSWIGCFTVRGADLAAAYLLDNLCYRSREQFHSLLDALFFDPSLFNESLKSDESFVEMLKKKPSTNEIKIAPVIGTAAPPTKSGPYILRLAQRRYNIHSDWLTWPRRVGEFSKIYFIDDFCGSGKQFTDFATSIDLNRAKEENPSLGVTYLVAAAHQVGLKKIADEFPFVKVKAIERLDSTNSVLSNEAFSHYKFAGFQLEVLKQYNSVIQSSGLPSSGLIKDGFGDLALAYAFAHATPNNTLPIFWYETSEWTPLLDR